MRGSKRAKPLHEEANQKHVEIFRDSDLAHSRQLIDGWQRQFCLTAMHRLSSTGFMLDIIFSRMIVFDRLIAIKIARDEKVEGRNPLAMVLVACSYLAVGARFIQVLQR
jgi:hypothetical protein